MTTIALSIEGMTCGHCIATVRKALATIPDVEEVTVALGTAVLRVPSAQASELADAAARVVTDAGYPATPAAPDPRRVSAPAALAAITAAESPTADGCCAPSPESMTHSRPRL